MMKIIQKDWLYEFKVELTETEVVRIVSPFLNENIVRHLLENFSGKKIELITRYNLNDFQSGVSSITALELLLKKKTNIKGIRDLHSKLYLFDNKCVIITSANFTNGGFFRNKEFGIKSYDDYTVSEANDYFNELWRIDEEILDTEKIDNWKKILDDSSHTKVSVEPLPDYGKSYEKKIIDSNKRYFIKFFGKNENRVSLDYHSKDEIREAHSHYTLSFSRKSNDKRPRKYRNGDIVFMAMLLQGTDYAIFGKAITYAHNDERDIASSEDIIHVPWREDWPILVRVHSPQFINSTMRYCPKMSQLISQLDYESFDKTLKKYNKGVRNINPWKSLRQQADVQLSEYGALWITKYFENAIKQYGAVDDEYINMFYQGRPIAE
ncbi:phospholipase D-like domain-containing protein [Chryseobacterium sp. PET-29]|uniref:phospholipase D-like domain-containing protein n=1 Tax=Chryseobacterium sp. PET-29 TaxID=2983267 RepID=UPI0021E55BCE|nr:phospholipase D-like domain-containing protein [Chryseobacterium sp. PET-29]